MRETWGLGLAARSLGQSLELRVDRVQGGGAAERSALVWNNSC